MSMEYDQIDGLVSTIIPVFNRPAMVVDAVQSVLDQDYRPIEIIIVDDGSTDETVETLNELSDSYDEVTVVRQTNQGPGPARENGRLRAKGEYVQYLDSDDLLLPCKFSLQVSALEASPHCDISYGITESCSSGETRPFKVWQKTDQAFDYLFPSFLMARWWSTSTPLYRRTATELAGAWLDTINEEDWEYDCRIASRGARLAQVKEVVSLRRFHDEDHLSADGTISVSKLAARCVSRKSIFRSMENSVVSIPPKVKEHFSKSLFLLARECASVNMQTEVEEMLMLSIVASGKKNIKHRVFIRLGRIFGWAFAAKVARLAT